ncbi:ATP-binding cassette domain-containing protein [Vibrio gangliei]|uniref:ATP-binding cassette domain-containing protein n=1 Tax=Vibrio gangliei TaxID=2077090 RepID=UPI000D022394|nr:ATP-binding cassette domain-containing protein [Vibrio gangliei]
MCLSIQNLSITKQHSPYDQLLGDFNLEIEPGEIVTLMGPSGCGKSTLLTVIAGHLSADFSANGQITLDGEAILERAPHQRSIGILFQDDMLFPHLNIWENIAFALPNHIKGKQRKQAALQVLHSIELAHLAESMPEQISGGQRARISLVRMLSAQPRAVLLDEPFGQLDPELRPVFRQWVFEQLQAANVPALMVTHDASDVPEGGKLIQWPKLTSAADN